jgi:hypothetical protein
MHGMFAQAYRTEVMSVDGPHQPAVDVPAPEFAKPLEHVVPPLSVCILGLSVAPQEQSTGQFFTNDPTGAGLEKVFSQKWQ